MLSLAALVDMVPVGILILQDAQHPDDVQVNRHGAELLGDESLAEAGTGPRRLHHPMRLFQGERELGPDEHPLQLATRSGRTVANFETLLLRPDGERRDVMVTATPLLDEAGKVRGGIAAVVDISERKHSEARQQVLLHELQHRVKNLIATIIALATRTLRRDVPAQDFVEAFQGRLRGMAATHEVLSRGNWQGAALGELVATALRSYIGRDTRNVQISGPELVMAPNAAATLGMVFYELATNAAKYGALAVPDGKVAVCWQVGGAPQDARVTLVWSEETGQSLAADSASGFGVNFVKRSVEYEMEGRAEMQPTADGMRWTLEFPIPQDVPRP
jgi:two-component system CheB/CheR fusion protein